MMEVRRYSWQDLSMHALPPMLLLRLLGDATPRMLHPLSVP